MEEEQLDINPLKSIWNTGRTAVGTYIMYSRDITTVQLAASAGLDFVVFDLEHRPHTIETIHDLCQVARILGMAPLVGPSDIASAEISRLLDVGASGVIIPHVKTALEVELAGAGYTNFRNTSPQGIYNTNLFPQQG